MVSISETDRREALRLCVEARACLQEAWEQLASAGRWGIVDILGGGLITGLVKHSRLGSARNTLDRVRPVLDRLSFLTRPLQGDTSVTGGPGEFAILADFLFDGLIADIYMQSRVRDMQGQVERAIRELDRLKSLLQGM